MISIGIDPGKSGAVAVILPHKVITYPFSRYSLAELNYYLAQLDLYDPPHVSFAVLERVHSMPGQGVSSSFKFGQYFGYAEALLVCNKIPFEFVSPQKWQKEMGCLSGGDKNVTKTKAQQLFPDIKITHNTADALLIAEYCRRIHV
jgi:crossover junction endodeoxyribonuclease RuvC